MTTDPAAGAGLADDGFAARLAAQLDAYAGRPDPSADAAEAGELVRHLREAPAWSAPPAGLRESILARARAEAAASPATQPSVPAAPSAVEPGPVAGAPPEAGTQGRRAKRPGAGSRWRARWGRLSWAIPVVAVGAAVFTAGVVAVDRALILDQPTPRGDTYAASGTSLAPGASATVRVLSTGSGYSVAADFTGLPPAAAGSYYTAWLRGPSGTVPLGSFHERKPWHDVTMWSGVDPAGYTTFLVTLQAEGDPPLPSNLVVMTGSLTR